jgi:hypothetical protein
MLVQIFFNRLLRLSYVDGQNDQSLVVELLIDLVDEARFLEAVHAPRGPEFE